jgi:hypothetical protein
MSKRFIATCIVHFAVVVFGGSLHAEEILGIKLGMTQVELSEKAKFLGANLDYQDLTPRFSNAFLRSSSNEFDIMAVINLCDRKVVGVSKSYDIGNDIMDKIKANNSKYGNPTVKIEEQDWSGPGGGTIKSIRHTWRSNNFRSEVSLTPEGRTANGALRYRQASHYSFDIPSSPCSTRKLQD